MSIHLELYPVWFNPVSYNHRFIWRPWKLPLFETMWSTANISKGWIIYEINAPTRLPSSRDHCMWKAIRGKWRASEVCAGIWQSKMLGDALLSRLWVLSCSSAYLFDLGKEMLLSDIQSSRHFGSANLGIFKWV